MGGVAASSTIGTGVVGRAGPGVRTSRRRAGILEARIGARRGRNVGRVAAARHLLTLVYYGLRDGEIRTLAARTG